MRDREVQSSASYTQREDLLHAVWTTSFNRFHELPNRSSIKCQTSKLKTNLTFFFLFGCSFRSMFTPRRHVFNCCFFFDFLHFFHPSVHPNAVGYSRDRALWTRAPGIRVSADWGFVVVVFFSTRVWRGFTVCDGWKGGSKQVVLKPCFAVCWSLLYFF